MASHGGGECTLCRGAHDLARCQEFKDASLKQKYDFLKKTGSCFRCLRRGHLAQECTAKGCSQCDGTHHDTLHGTLHNTLGHTYYYGTDSTIVTDDGGLPK